MKWHFSCEGKEWQSCQNLRNFCEDLLKKSVLTKFIFLFFRTREVPNWSRSGFYDLTRPDLSGRSTVSGPVKKFFSGQCRRGHSSRDFSHDVLKLNKIFLFVQLIHIPF